MANLKHVHTYQRYKKRTKGKLLKDTWWKCANPHCSHTADYELTIGKASLCNKCGTEFILDAEAMRRVRPCCLNCSATKEGKQYRAAQSIMTKLFPESGEAFVEPDPFGDL